MRDKPYRILYVDAALGLRLVQPLASIPCCDVEARIRVGLWYPAMCWPDGLLGVTKAEMTRSALGWAAKVWGELLDAHPPA